MSGQRHAGAESGGGVVLQHAVSLLEQQHIHVPRPQRPNAAFSRSQSALTAAPSGLTASLHCRTNSFGSANDVELLEIMLKPADAPAASYFGCSPPVRAGAANPWSHDRSWKLSAYSASSTNLQALRELDSAGESFLRAKDSSTGRLVLSGSAAPIVDASDAGSDTTAVNATAPFTCHTAYFL